MDLKAKVLRALKPKVKAFGFNKRELMSVAAEIADNLSLEEDASEEDVTAAIDAAVETSLPFLKVGQSFANRLLEGSKHKNDDESGEGEERDQQTPQLGEANPELAALMNAVKALTDQVTALKADKTTGSRRERLQSVVKDAGAFGTRALKNFSRMKFESDDDFDEWLEDVESDLKDYQQERADAGLTTLAGNPVKGSLVKDEKTEVMSDKELEDLAGHM